MSSKLSHHWPGGRIKPEHHQKICNGTGTKASDRDCANDSLYKNGRKRNGSLFYTIRPIEEAKEYYFEQQLQRAEEETARQKARKLFEQRRQEQTRKVV